MRIALASGSGDALALRFVRVLAGADHAVCWITGAAAGPVPPGVEQVSLARSDGEPGHWQKSWHPATTRALRKRLREGAFDVLHVLSWRGLSRDLVHGAAREHVPAVLSLQDASSSCLLGTRRTPEGEACDVPAAPRPCLACAARALPTPWLPPDAQFLARHTQQQDFERELALARAVLVHDSAARDHARRFHAGTQIREIRAAELGDAELARALSESLAGAIAAGAPDPGAPENPYATLLAEASAREWDAARQRARG